MVLASSYRELKPGCFRASLPYFHYETTHGPIADDDSLLLLLKFIATGLLLRSSSGRSS